MQLSENYEKYIASSLFQSVYWLEILKQTAVENVLNRMKIMDYIKDEEAQYC
jgi:hypothetical protein